jgi:Na+-transporting NADH:ubiquinone oxidoreductase subunit NqrB
METSLQAQFLIPMAVSVAYGLMIATFITLLILPVALVLLNDIKYYTAKFISRTTITREMVEPAVREVRFENE